jgi:hypothetical protein
MAKRIILLTTMLILLVLNLLTTASPQRDSIETRLKNLEAEISLLQRQITTLKSLVDSRNKDWATKKIRRGDSAAKERRVLSGHFAQVH